MSDSQMHLRMENIWMSFGSNDVLCGVDFEAHPGEVVALMGANGAGKSTLMNILTGLYHPTRGSIYLNDERVEFKTPLDATHKGIAFIQQEMTLMPTMSVLDNLFLTSYESVYGLINYKALAKKCSGILERLGFKYSLNTLVSDLGAGDRQLIQIARALLENPSIIVFDEATSSLSVEEKNRLFSIIESLRTENATIVYITHALDELFELSSKVVVLRGGKVVGYRKTDEISHKDIVQMMIGDDDEYSRAIEQANKRSIDPETLPVRLEVRGLSRAGVLDNISFDLHDGEILGIWGLMGSGRTETIRALTGLDPIDGGTIRIHGKNGLTPIKPSVLREQVALITEDRRMDGLALEMTVRENMSSANLRSFAKGRIPTFMDRNLERSTTREYVKKLNIKLTGTEQRVKLLSGGNQQKVVLARWLQKAPQIYLFDEPTRGLDIGAKGEILQVIKELAQQGVAVLVILSEISELMSISDRYMVLYDGKITSFCPGSASQEQLMCAAVNCELGSEGRG